MLNVRKPISIDDALQRLLVRCKSGLNINVSLEESDGYVLAENIRATHDVPPFNRSSYDGFAIRSIDTKNASVNSKVSFRVIDHIGAGQVSDKKLQRQEAIRIMTGAPLPEQADAIVMLEQTELKGDTFTVDKQFSSLENVSLLGEDIQQGALIAEKGSYIHPGIIAILATFGYTHVNVIKKPIVGIVATGTELLAVHDELKPGKIRNSNSPMIISQLKRLGISTKVYGMIDDHIADYFQVIQQALAETDCVITTGGVSVGDYDYFPQVYDQLNAQTLFNKIAVRPGSVTTVACINDKLLFGLSGNPSSCFIGFELFVRPALKKIMGSNNLFLPQIKATLIDDYVTPNRFTRLIRGIVSYDGEKVNVKSVGFNGSNAVSSLAHANALIALPSGDNEYRRGMKVTVLLLDVADGVSKFII